MRVEGLDEVIGLDAAVRHACAVARDGAVWCWGSNVAQQLGFVNAEDEDPFAPLPLRIAGLPAALRVATGHAHSCAITRERKVHCWGDNRFGQLGDATTESRPSPAAVHDLADVADLSLGAFHSCARTRAGALYCWGRNEAGQLGLGDTTDRSTPARVALDGVQALSAGERHTCAIANARVHCWGEGEGGRLGDGDELDRSSPAPVQGIGDAVQVAAGERHSCALERGGDVQCWGVNDGQLGDGSTAQRMLPVRVEMPAAARD